MPPRRCRLLGDSHAGPGRGHPTVLMSRGATDCLPVEEDLCNKEHSCQIGHIEGRSTDGCSYITTTEHGTIQSVQVQRDKKKKIKKSSLLSYPFPLSLLDICPLPALHRNQHSTLRLTVLEASGCNPSLLQQPTTLNRSCRASGKCYVRMQESEAYTNRKPQPQDGKATVQVRERRYKFDTSQVPS